MCEHVNDVKAKRQLERMLDPAIAAYALDRDLIVVSRNLSDFRRLYRSRPMHPGLVLLSCPEAIRFSSELQRQMLAAAVDGVPGVAGIRSAEPLQEVFTVDVSADENDDWIIKAERFHLPDP